MADNKIKYSVIFLLEEQYDDFAEFVEDIYDLFLSRKESFEIIIMANGTGGFLRRELHKFDRIDGKLMAFEFNTKTAQTVCLKAAVKESCGELLVVLGSYKQLSNKSINALLDSVDEATDIICACRRQRVDSLLNQLRSRAFNSSVRLITGYGFHDLNCTVRAFRREVIEETDLYGNMYRFLPILAIKKGFKTKEIGCFHDQERGKFTLLSPSSYIARLLDIFTLLFNTRFTRKPLRFFSAIGLMFIVVGAFIDLFVLFEKLVLGAPIGGRVLLLLGVLTMILGVQAVSVGLLGEIIAFTHGRHRKDYTIEKII